MDLVSRFLIIVCALLFLAAPSPPQQEVTGEVVDFQSGGPVAGAIVTSGGETVKADDSGRFRLVNAADRVMARAPGYRRGDEPAAPSLVIRLAPFTPKALYLTVFGIGAKSLREPALRLIGETGLNALVIDVKGDRGLVPYPSAVPLAKTVGARRYTTVRDLPRLVAGLKQKGLYTIARIVVFKDNPLATARPELAVTGPGGKLWRDRERLAWVDPFKREVWEYNIAIAEEAAQAGFDEIQFDYVRFPDANGLVFSHPTRQQDRIDAIAGFLVQARERLRPYNVFLAADIFGYVCWNLNDTRIGQRLEELAPILDYISPMLYPSGFRFGIPGYRNPVGHPYEIVSLSLKRAQKRTGLAPVRFRPWLQAFRDYAFDRRRFGGDEIRAQIRAAEEFGSGGWMLWNPANVYSAAGLKSEGVTARGAY